MYPTPAPTAAKRIDLRVSRSRGVPETKYATPLARRLGSAGVTRDEFSTEWTDDQGLLRGLRVSLVEVSEGDSRDTYPISAVRGHVIRFELQELTTASGRIAQ